jgi:hypothetical protein
MGRSRPRLYHARKNLFALLQAESEGFTWKSYMWNLPCGVLKFALNASIDTLPIFTNLKRWGEACLCQLPSLWEHCETDAFPCSCSL